MRVYTSRPTTKVAKFAWDLLVAFHSDRKPLEMWRAKWGLHDHSYVMKFNDGEHEEIDTLTVRSRMQANKVTEGGQ